MEKKCIFSGTETDNRDNVGDNTECTVEYKKYAFGKSLSKFFCTVLAVLCAAVPVIRFAFRDIADISFTVIFFLLCLTLAASGVSMIACPYWFVREEYSHEKNRKQIGNCRIFGIVILCLVILLTVFMKSGHSYAYKILDMLFNTDHGYLRK